MCQGIVVSLVKFKNKKKNVRVVLSGIGSHSDLVKTNLKKLKRAGWKENVSGESIISIESDFSAWNKFTIESEAQPNRVELKTLRDTYKKCAGNAKALIYHVKRCGIIDDALVNLLTAPALAEYKKVTASALAEYEKVTASAGAEYKKVTAPALAEYKKVTAPALAEYEKVTASAGAEYKKVTASAGAEYKKVTASALAEYEKVTASAGAEYKKVTAPALAEYKKVTAPALAEYEKVKASAWIKLFSVKANRAPHLQ